RERNVTGVQTCALPISRAEIAGRAVDDDGLSAAQAGALQAAERHDQLCQSDQLGCRLVVEIGERRGAGGRPMRDLRKYAVAPARSEERRVGRGGWRRWT